jgi:hypothetical protein
VSIRSRVAAARSIPSGLRGRLGTLAIGPGVSARTAQPAATLATLAQATGRQRRDGSRPVGNSNSSKVNASPTHRAPVHSVSHAITTPPGSDPCRGPRAYRAYSSAKPPRVPRSPERQHSHPMVLRGWRETTTAPTPQASQRQDAPGGGKPFRRQGMQQDGEPGQDHPGAPGHPGDGSRPHGPLGSCRSGGGDLTARASPPARTTALRSLAATAAIVLSGRARPLDLNDPRRPFRERYERRPRQRAVRATDR